MKTNNNYDLNWKFPEGMEYSGRSFDEIISSVHESIIKANGRLYTEEEAAKITNEIRKELREKGEID